MRVIVDCMGGDRGPAETVRGAYEASKEYSASFTLVGSASAIRAVAAADGMDLRRFDVVDAPVTVEMEDDPLCVTRAKKDSSMAVSLRLLAEGRGDAVVSTGNTGALFAGSTLIVRKIKGIKRAAIAGLLPMDPPVLLLDSGANVVCTEEYLEQFALMGSIYMHRVYGVASPRVGLLNNGTEECKGTPLQLAAYARLSELAGIDFVGNVEASRIPRNACDVLVADGFTGNVLLKSFEGMGRLMLDTVKGLFSSDVVGMAGGLLLRRRLTELKKTFDSSEHGGAPLLGISRPVIKAHGASDARAVKNAVRQAISYAQSGAILAIARETRLFAPAPASRPDAAVDAARGTVAGEAPPAEE
jgi:glycerol-3-phosphate acyltransferase PlsX